MTVTIFWFRNDLRLTDQPALQQAIETASTLLPVFCHDPATDTETAWGFARTGSHRHAFLRAALDDLTAQLRALGSDLIELQGVPSQALSTLAQRIGSNRIVCETIAAPEEEAQVAALRKHGVSVETIWQSSLLDPADLPFAIDRLPDMFTAFRHAVEKADVTPPLPLPAITAMPPLPSMRGIVSNPVVLHSSASAAADARSSFPYWLPTFDGGEAAALAHLDRYLAKKLAHTYKETRNGLSGTDYSTKFSPWLATGALSARSVYQRLKKFEHAFGANDSSYWIWFELLWRDHFRFLHVKYGRRLYRGRGLADASMPAPKHHAAMFKRWIEGRTGEAIVDSGMRELAATGYLSNRLRQIVASYLIHDLGGDWRAGAAWFESQLIDYDVCSNQGNWLYLAGRGTDPRGGRRFDMRKQTSTYDSDGKFRAMWAG